MKVTLTSLANLGPLPVAIYGSNGKPYGHARYDASQNRSTLELAYEDYLRIGPDIARNSTGPLNQWFATFTPEEGEADTEGLKARVKELEAANDSLQKRLDDLAAQPSVTAQGNLSNLSGANPETAAPAAPAHTLDSQVEALRVARDLPRMADDSIEPGPDGSLEKVHRELHPVQAGSPVEDLAADGQTGKTTTRVPVEGTHLEIIEEREKIEAPKDPSTLRANVEAATGGKDVPNQDAAEASTAQAVEQGVAATGGEAEGVTPAQDDTDPDEKGGEEDLAQYKSNFRKLRSIAKAEGVEDFEKHTTSDDMIAAITLHRESKK